MNSNVGNSHGLLIDNPLYANNGQFENPLYDQDRNAGTFTEAKLQSE
jgi:hypothetical protein